MYLGHVAPSVRKKLQKTFWGSFLCCTEMALPYICDRVGLGFGKMKDKKTKFLENGDLFQSSL